MNALTPIGSVESLHDAPEPGLSPAEARRLEARGLIRFGVAPAKPAKPNFAVGEVEAAILRLAPTLGEFTVTEMTEALGQDHDVQRGTVHHACRRLARRGRLRCVHHGKDRGNGWLTFRVKGAPAALATRRGGKR